MVRRIGNTNDKNNEKENNNNSISNNNGSNNNLGIGLHRLGFADPLQGITSSLKSPAFQCGPDLRIGAESIWPCKWGFGFRARQFTCKLPV